jgi:methyl-accepting chemotaxis protein
MFAFYRTYLNHTPVRRLIRGLVFGAIVSATIVVVGNGIIAWQAHKIDKEWTHYEQEPAQKGIILSQLRHAVGYGGVIHQFKNYMLRQDEPRVAKTENKMRAATEAISAYRALPLNTRETQALDTISTTFEKYRNALKTAQRLTAQGKTPWEIDAVVKIDDGPALEAFLALDEELRQATQASADTVNGSVAMVNNTTLLSGVIATLLIGAFAVAVSLVLNTILRQLGDEPSRILEIVQRIARGDLTMELSPANPLPVSMQRYKLCRPIYET